MAKEFSFKGKTLEELKKMSLKDLSDLLSARARRTIKRGFTNAQKALLKKVKKANSEQLKKPIRTHCRDMIIIPSMVGLLFHVHNGKTFVPVKVLPEMIGHYLGEFALTRQGVKHSAPGVGATRSSAAVSVK